MHIIKKGLRLAVLTTFILVIWVLRNYHVLGLGHANGHIETTPYNHTNPNQNGKIYPEDLTDSTGSLNFSTGAPATHFSTLTRTLVTACMDKKEVAWMQEELSNTNLSIYVANDLAANLHPPKNKGHEVIIYLTYIIDHYAALPDIIIFMHAHRWTRHNNEVLDFDAAQMIRRLSSSYVMRQGYVNMRCDWAPGCPDWLHPSSTQESLKKQEEAVLSKSWSELFPLDPLPPFLAQACCAQFAVSKERILSIPLSRFIFYRDWMLATPLSDYISGRIWEYSWHFVFTGEHSYCPAQHLCYCDGFGICFEGEGFYNEFQELLEAKNQLKSELENAWDGPKAGNAVIKSDPRSDLNSARDAYLRNEIRRLSEKLIIMKKAALRRDKKFSYYQEM